MKRLIVVLTFMALLVPALSHAEGDEGPLPFSADVGDTASVQRGARDFVNYCSGCHTLKYLRYNQMASGLGIPEAMLKKNLMFVSGLKSSSEMINAMTPSEGEAWFNKAPPNLTLEAGYRSPRWIYNYLQSFYLDPKQPTGVNNTLLKNVAMPDVVWSLQGWQKQVTDKDGETHFEPASKGSMTQAQFQGFAADITNFLAFASSPDQIERSSLGPKVIIFLLILLVLTYLLKKEFWRDIH